MLNFLFVFLECGRIFVGVVKGVKMMRLYIDSVVLEKLKGICIFFVRCRNDVVINNKNIYEVCLYFF